MERRFLTGREGREVRVEQRGSDPPIIAGYGAVYYVAGDAGTEYDLFGDGTLMERLMPGCFDRACRECDVRALFNHDPNLILGRNVAGTMTLAADARGLRYEIRVDPDAPLAQGVLSAIRRGDVSGSSFAFTVVREQYVKPTQKGQPYVREIYDVQLYDVGPVVYPAYDGTTTAVRAAGDTAEARAAFEAWQKSLAGQITRMQALVRARCAELGL